MAVCIHVCFKCGSFSCLLLALPNTGKTDVTSTEVDNTLPVYGDLKRDDVFSKHIDLGELASYFGQRAFFCCQFIRHVFFIVKFVLEYFGEGTG